jgi:hypothetical protein
VDRFRDANEFRDDGRFERRANVIDISLVCLRSSQQLLGFGPAEQRTINRGIRSLSLFSGASIIIATRTMLGSAALYGWGSVDDRSFDAAIRSKFAFFFDIGVSSRPSPVRRTTP